MSTISTPVPMGPTTFPLAFSVPAAVAGKGLYAAIFGDNGLSGPQVFLQSATGSDGNSVLAASPLSQNMTLSSSANSTINVTNGTAFPAAGNNLLVTQTDANGDIRLQLSAVYGAYATNQFTAVSFSGIVINPINATVVLSGSSQVSASLAQPLVLTGNSEGTLVTASAAAFTAGGGAIIVTQNDTAGTATSSTTLAYTSYDAGSCTFSGVTLTTVTINSSSTDAASVMVSLAFGWTNSSSLNTGQNAPLVTVIPPGTYSSPVTAVVLLPVPGNGNAGIYSGELVMFVGQNIGIAANSKQQLVVPTPSSNPNDHFGLFEWGLSGPVTYNGGGSLDYDVSAIDQVGFPFQVSSLMCNAPSAPLPAAAPFNQGVGFLPGRSSLFNGYTPYLLGLPAASAADAFISLAPEYSPYAKRITAPQDMLNIMVSSGPSFPQSAQSGFTPVQNPASSDSVFTFSVDETSVSIQTAGTGYVNPPTLTFTSPGSGGTAADATAVLGTGTAAGQVVGVTFTNAGSGYTSAPTIQVSAPPVAVQALATAQLTAGVVTGVQLTNGGNGYVNIPQVSFDAAPAGGTTATGIAVLGSGNTAGQVTSVTITNAGSGYTTTPNVSIAAPTGVSASGVAVLGTGSTTGQLTGITVTNGGQGYPAPPVITIGAPAGVQATAIAKVSAAGIIQAVKVVKKGNGYSSTPNVSFLPLTDNNAGAVAKLGTGNNCMTVAGISVLNGGGGYTRKVKVKIDPPQGIQAVATSNMSGSSVASVSVANNGGGYCSVPSVSFAAPPSQQAAIAVALAGDTFYYAVTGLRIVVTMTSGGSGYTSAPTVTFSLPSSGTAATGIALMGTGAQAGQVTGVYITNPGSGYTAAPTVSFSADEGSGAGATVAFVESMASSAQKVSLNPGTVAVLNWLPYSYASCYKIYRSSNSDMSSAGCLNGGQPYSSPMLAASTLSAAANSSSTQISVTPAPGSGIPQVGTLLITEGENSSYFQYSQLSGSSFTGTMFGTASFSTSAVVSLLPNFTDLGTAGTSVSSLPANNYDYEPLNRYFTAALLDFFNYYRDNVFEIDIPGSVSTRLTGHTHDLTIGGSTYTVLKLTGVNGGAYGNNYVGKTANIYLPFFSSNMDASAVKLTLPPPPSWLATPSESPSAMVFAADGVFDTPDNTGIVNPQAPYSTMPTAIISDILNPINVAFNRGLTPRSDGNGGWTNVISPMYWSQDPLFPLTAQVSQTGGTLPQQTYYYALTGVNVNSDSSGQETIPTNIVTIDQSQFAAAATNSVTLNVPSTGATTFGAYNLYRGTSPGNLTCIAQVTPAAAGTSTTITDDGSVTGLVSRVAVTNGGSNYTSAPAVTFAAAPQGGQTAQGTAVLGTGAAAKQVVSITITNPGSGYTSAPAVSFSGGGGTGATAQSFIAPSFLMNAPGQLVNWYAAYLHELTVSINGFSYGTPYDDQGSFSTNVGLTFGSATPLAPQGLTITLLDW